MTQGSRYDLLVVGGGINGAGIARDAAGRGLSVLLCEQDDLAAHTSSASTKLIHGGLRYLEYREFGLVRKALQERETLLRAAPHIMWPLRFVMPHMPDLRPAWLIRAGLFLYDHLASRELLPGSRGIVMRKHPAGAPLVDSIKRGFVYSDGWVKDARLVVLNALDAAEHGAKILTRTRLLSAARARRRMARATRATPTARPSTCAPPRLRMPPARGSANCCTARSAGRRTHSVRLVKGSHIVTRRLFEQRSRVHLPESGQAHHLRDSVRTRLHADRHDRPRISTAIRRKSRSTPTKRSTCATRSTAISSRTISPQDVRWTYSGVRPLLEEEGADNASAVTRDYSLELDAPPAKPAAVGVRRQDHDLPQARGRSRRQTRACAAQRHAAWTAGAPLPGGDIPQANFERFLGGFKQQHAWLPADWRTASPARTARA